MSAPKYRIPAKARALLLERDMTVARLAERSYLSITRVMHAVSNHPEGTLEDRRRLLPHLTMAEAEALGWRADGELLPVEQFEKCSTPKAA